MAKLLPFVVQPRTEIRAVGTPEIGVIHLLKKGGISPNENPVDIQQAGTRQAKTQLLLESATKRLADEERITRKEARKRLFAMPVSKEETNGEAEVDMPSLYDYLSQEEATQLLNLRENHADTAIKAATLFIQHRVAYPVQVTAKAKAGEEKLAIAPLSFEIADGQKIRFGGLRVEVDGYHEPESEELKVKSLKQPLAAEAIGYLQDPDVNKLLLGNSEWSEQDTRDCLTEELILHIHHFYQIEMGGVPEEEEAQPDADEGKNLASSSSVALPAAA
ncbi:hypothetical protein H6G00_00680 [Leptolyngbya sp. FACHB-541]|uniref:hypothetical protein n=1 Tax=Leptolyngbya sp. FACHB-541 TaxID=2692810 RepID=UPI001688DC12|nr:hypothetical protein [Leptolyngbya sp. FACHB-541]MBD1995142.1 hypothetical protein [Leptolyngbya sp. FACHB-541]